MTQTEGPRMKLTLPTAEVLDANLEGSYDAQRLVVELPSISGDFTRELAGEIAGLLDTRGLEGTVRAAVFAPDAAGPDRRVTGLTALVSGNGDFRLVVNGVLVETLFGDDDAPLTPERAVTLLCAALNAAGLDVWAGYRDAEALTDWVTDAAHEHASKAESAVLRTLLAQGEDALGRFPLMNGETPELFAAPVSPRPSGAVVVVVIEDGVARTLCASQPGLSAVTRGDDTEQMDVSALPVDDDGLRVIAPWTLAEHDPERAAALAAVVDRGAPAGELDDGEAAVDGTQDTPEQDALANHEARNGPWPTQRVYVAVKLPTPSGKFELRWSRDKVQAEAEFQALLQEAIDAGRGGRVLLARYESALSVQADHDEVSSELTDALGGIVEDAAAHLRSMQIELPQATLYQVEFDNDQLFYVTHEGGRTGYVGTASWTDDDTDPAHFMQAIRDTLRALGYEVTLTRKDGDGLTFQDGEKITETEAFERELMALIRRGGDAALRGLPVGDSR